MKGWTAVVCYPWHTIFITPEASAKLKPELRGTIVRVPHKVYKLIKESIRGQGVPKRVVEDPGVEVPQLPTLTMPTTITAEAKEAIRRRLPEIIRSVVEVCNAQELKSPATHGSPTGH